MVPNIHAVLEVETRHPLDMPSYIPPSTIRIPSQAPKFRFKGKRHDLKKIAAIATVSTLVYVSFRVED